LSGSEGLGWVHIDADFYLATMEGAALVAFIAMIADRLISAWARQRKKDLGLE